MNSRIEALIEALTPEEKISLLAGADMWRTAAIPRLGIPALKMTDGPIGARGDDAPGGPTSACFPCGAALAATWNPELVERVGRALGAETRAKGAQILLAPTVNIHRSPLAGRNFECYSEDPYLTARLAIAYIRGVQSQGVGACIKHFVCNDSEFERRSISSEVSERPLREIYLRPFQLALREARPWAVMSSYNRVNGVHASENDYLLKEILKGEWGFDGIVMSDWWGTYSRRVVRGGLDLEMPGPARWMGKPAREALRGGAVSAATIDDKVRRLLLTLERTGLFDRPELPAEQGIDRPEHRQLAREAAGEAIVLLKNDRAVLPLDAASAKSIAVIGANAKWASIMGGGSTRVWPHYVISPLDAIRERVGAERAPFAPGAPIHRKLPLFDAHLLARPFTLEYFANRDLSGEPCRVETTVKPELGWNGDPLPGLQAANFSARLSGTFAVPESGRYLLSVDSKGQSRLRLDGRELIDLWAEPYRRNEVSGTAEVELHAGEPHTLRVEFGSAPGLHFQSLRLGCMLALPPDALEQAVRLAAASEVAIVFAGLTSEWESEEFDRPDMGLPGQQDELIERVSAANPNTVVVLNAGSPVAMPWLDRVAAVVQAWYLGQETGHAIADVLFGDVNPSGKLPTTFPRRLQDNPAFLNYPGENGKVHYGEGLFVGYRYYDKKDIEPLFPFGYGLSYTTFAYRNLAIEPGETVRVSFEVENTGPREGKEIAQLYVRDVRSRLVRPEKELKGLAKVALRPGERRTVSLALDAEALSYYDDARRQWVVEPGEFEVLVGASSRDIRLRGRFTRESG